jgi:hypothetical protein
MEEMTEGWRKLRNEELHNLYMLTNIIRVMKPKRMTSCGGVPRNFVRWGGGLTNSVEDRENGDLRAVAP